MKRARLPAPLFPRTRYGDHAEPDAYDGRGTKLPSHDFVGPERVATVEQSVATGYGLDEVAETSGLTPQVCWTIAVRLARPNALEIRRDDYVQVQQRALQLQAAMAGVLNRLQRLANRLEAEQLPRLSNGLLAVVVTLEDVVDVKGGRS